jgi:hypothetical protein
VTAYPPFFGFLVDMFPLTSGMEPENFVHLLSFTLKREQTLKNA